MITVATLMLLLFSGPLYSQVSDPAIANCALANQAGEQTHHVCKTTATQKSFHILNLKGDMSRTAYYHGLFLQNEIETGLLLGVQTELSRALVGLSPKERKQFELVSQCIITRFKQSVSTEFLQTMRALHKGMRDAGSKVTYKELVKANLMVDLSIYFENLERGLKKNPGATKRKVALYCGPHLLWGALGSSLSKMLPTFQKLKMGCTGAATSAHYSSDGALVLGRNFDSGLLGFFEKHPLIIVQTLPNGIQTLGLASAGLHYASGISGFNSNGIVASLHQLQTENTEMLYEERGADTTPFLLQKILNTSHSLPEALNQSATTKAFGAWTIFIGDSKTDELASIEIAGKDTVLARHNQQQFLAQSNHYLAPSHQKAGYEYSLNKSLESRARLNWVTRNLSRSKGQINYQSIIDLLSGHTDALVGQRSFGRTTTKVYTAATHVLIPSRKEWWMTLGETYPTNQGYFYGMRLIHGKVEIFDRTRATSEYSIPHWNQSKKHYVHAYKIHEDNFKNPEVTQKVILELDKAIELARLDQITELPYLYIRGRMHLYHALTLASTGNQKEQTLALNKAALDFKTLLSDMLSEQITHHPYEKALTHLWLARVYMSFNQTNHHPLWKKQASQAKQILRSLSKAHPQHWDLYNLYKNADQFLTHEEILSIPVGFGTIE